MISNPFGSGSSPIVIPAPTMRRRVGAWQADHSLDHLELARRRIALGKWSGAYAPWVTIHRCIDVVLRFLQAHLVAAPSRWRRRHSRAELRGSRSGTGTVVVISGRTATWPDGERRRGPCIRWMIWRPVASTVVTVGSTVPRTRVPTVLARLRRLGSICGVNIALGPSRVHRGRGGSPSSRCSTCCCRLHRRWPSSPPEEFYFSPTAPVRFRYSRVEAEGLRWLRAGGDAARGDVLQRDPAIGHTDRWQEGL